MVKYFARQAGYSLLEVITVAALVAVLSYVGANFYGRYLQRANTKKVLIQMAKIESSLIDEMTTKGFPLWRQFFADKGWNCDEPVELIQVGNQAYSVGCQNCGNGVDCLRIIVSGLDGESVDLDMLLGELGNAGADCDFNDETGVLDCTYE